MDSRLSGRCINKFIFMFAGLLLGGCASSQMVPYQVESAPPGAQIDVDGNSVGITPTEIKLQCSRHWVGLAHSSTGYAPDSPNYKVTATPSNSAPGYTQTRSVNPCEITTPPGHLFFNLQLEKVQPRQRIDVNVDSNGSGRNASLEDTIRSLKRLRDQGLLTNQEYKRKVNQAVSRFSK